MSKKAKATDGLAQRDRFIEAARELGADDDEATFKEKLAVIGKQKPKGASVADSEMEARDQSKT